MDRREAVGRDTQALGEWGAGKCWEEPQVLKVEGKLSSIHFDVLVGTSASH